MIPPFAVEVLRGLPYDRAEARMIEVLEARISGQGPDSLLLVEPEPTFTLGRRPGAGAHVLAPGQIPVRPAARGGDVTYHGPGQLVAWPVFALPEGLRDLHLWLHGLELVVLELLAGWGLAPRRDARNTGVWLGGKKVCAIGIGCRRWVTWHGLALNLDLDLAPFDRIDPCGLGRGTVARVADLLQPCPPWEEAAAGLVQGMAAWWTGQDPAAAVAASLRASPIGSEG